MSRPAGWRALSRTSPTTWAPSDRSTARREARPPRTRRARGADRSDRAPRPSRAVWHSRRRRRAASDAPGLRVDHVDRAAGREGDDLVENVGELELVLLAAGRPIHMINPE